MSDAGENGVRCVQPDCGDLLVHRHQGGDYGIADIPDLFQLGRVVADEPDRECVAFTAAELHELKVLADAYSFDFEEGLIELCLDLHRFAQQRRESEFVFVQDS